MQHLDEGTIHAWLDGELSADDAERAARHVAECAECGALVVEARGVMAGATRIVSALDAGPVGVIPRTQRGAQPKRRSWYRFALTPARMSIAATILVAAGVTLTVQRARVGRDGVDASRMIDSPIPAAMAAAPAARTDSMTVIPAAPKAAPAPPNDGPQAHKTQNSPLGAPKPFTAARTVDAGAGLADKERAPEAKARVADSIERAAPAAAPAPPSVSTSIAMAALPARLDSVRAKDEGARAAAGGNQLTQVTTSGDRDALSKSEASSQNCYRLDIDSTEWRHALPSAFALGGPAVSAGRAGGAIGGAGSFREPAANAQSAMRAVMVAPGNAVHAVTATGSVDSLVVGDWRPAGPALVSVHFSAVAKQKPVTLVLATNGSTAQLISGERTDSVRFVRMTCAR